MRTQWVRGWSFAALLTGCALLFLVTAADGQDQKPMHAAVKPVPRTGGWVKRHESFVERGKQGGVDVLFLGDSITQGWEGSGKNVWAKRYEPMRAANFGIGGDRTEHVLWRITEGKELENITPKVVVLMIGTNNTFANSAEEIADGVTAIVQEIRKQKPTTKVLLLAVFPRDAKPETKSRIKIKEINQRLAKLADGKDVRYLDIGEWFLAEEGRLPREIMPDSLHLSELGYQLWAAAIEVPLKEMLAP